MVRRQGNGFSVSLHCGFDGAMPIVEAHRLSSRIEEAVKKRIPGVESVLVHTEPELRLKGRT
jgi:divalent metal cation (Fe/Co/Zn/Cd) transporter